MKVKARVFLRVWVETDGARTLTEVAERTGMAPGESTFLSKEDSALRGKTYIVFRNDFVIH
jgi:hypothetical protein